MTFQSVQLQPHDVLSGRGNAVKFHPGNLYFRELVQAVKHHYVALPITKKLLVSKLVVEAIQSLHPPGRYLKIIESDHGDLYEEISIKKALAKTSQALREGQPDIKHEFIIAGCNPNRNEAEFIQQTLQNVEDILDMFTAQRNGVVNSSQPMEDSCHHIMDITKEQQPTNDIDRLFVEKKKKENSCGSVQRNGVVKRSQPMEDSCHHIMDITKEQQPTNDIDRLFVEKKKKENSCGSVQRNGVVKRSQPMEDSCHHIMDITKEQQPTNDIDRLFVEKKKKENSWRSERRKWVVNSAQPMEDLRHHIMDITKEQQPTDDIDRLFEEKKKKEYSCRSLDIDSDFDEHKCEVDIPVDQLITFSDSIRSTWSFRHTLSNENSGWSLVKQDVVMETPNNGDVYRLLERSISNISVTDERNVEKSTSNRSINLDRNLERTISGRSITRERSEEIMI